MVQNDMENREAIEQELRQHGVRVTAVRLMVWRTLKECDNTFSLADAEELLPTVDRSTVFRTLRLLAENHLLHEVDDGSGVLKYCVCRCSGQHHLSHVHFSCVKCGTTFCIKNQEVPVVDLPEGFELGDVEYVIKGRCPKCAQRL